MSRRRAAKTRPAPRATPRTPARASAEAPALRGTPTIAAARTGTSRIASARKRAETAKVAFAGGGLVIFALAMGLARGSVSGHAKPTIRPLSAPPRFVSVVHSDQLRAGILGPAQAPAGAATSVS